MQVIPSFNLVMQAVHLAFLTRSQLVHSSHWQAVDVSAKPEMSTHEVAFFGFTTHMDGEDLDFYRRAIGPNLPWADDHFAERVGGHPLNPGEQWKKWPWGNSAEKFLDAGGQFNHNYMERYWPKYAGLWATGAIPANAFDDPLFAPPPNFGIRNPYGDLNDVVKMLVDQPLTRQAYLPIFFPEDTGAPDGGRLPCTLGYHLLRRNGQLHISYLMRSCDFKRHFADDIYLTVRLALWVLERLRASDPGNWEHVTLGSFTFYTASLHIFRNDWRSIFGDTPWPDALAGAPAVSARDRGNGGIH